MKIYQIQINPETCTVDVVMGNGKLRQSAESLF